VPLLRTPKLEIVKFQIFLSTVDPDCQLRFVPRATYFYAQLLERIAQPRFLRDGSVLAFDLMSMHSAVQNVPDMKSTLHAIVDDEFLQLLRGDIPYFHTKASQQHLYTSREILANFFSLSGIANAKRKLDNFEQSDIDEQSALLAISLGDKHAYKPKENTRQTLTQTPTDTRIRNGDAHNLLDLANHITGSSFQPGHEPARWLSLYGDVSGTDLRAEAGDSAFFGGAWGILLALQAVESSISNQTNSANLQEFLDHQALLWAHELERHNNPIQSLGFAGLGGEFFAHSQLITLNSKRWGFLSASIENRLNEVMPSIKKDSWLDVIGGTAGLLLGCAKLVDLDLSTKVKDSLPKVISEATIHLINSTTNFADYTVWHVPGERLPLLGYAHGWAGIVVALSSALKYCDPELRKESSNCIDRSRAYPESLYLSSKEWFDHRSSKEPNRSTNIKPLDNSWCNGTAGLLRGLLELKPDKGNIISDGILHLSCIGSA
jgi:lantibiotic modifying enzyme